MLPCVTSTWSYTCRGKAQWTQLRSTFPTGVCDWTKPGVEQQGLIGTWISFDDGEDGERDEG